MEQSKTYSKEQLSLLQQVEMSEEKAWTLGVNQRYILRLKSLQTEAAFTRLEQKSCQLLMKSLFCLQSHDSYNPQYTRVFRRKTHFACLLHVLQLASFCN